MGLLGLSHLQQNKSVPVLSVEQLLENHGICHIGTFKVDVEGLDGDLLVAFSKWMKEANGCRADRVIGEFNELSEGMTGFELVNEELISAGYSRGVKGGFDRIWTFNNN